MILDIGLIQMAGIMPTLILAQVYLGRACQDVEDEFTMPHTWNYINSKAPTSLDWTAASHSQQSKEFTVLKNHQPNDEHSSDQVQVKELDMESGLGKWWLAGWRKK